ncbi:MAG: hypothetical protein JST52_08845 [Bacteroidetes bacterium]|nr:hypothetical protein [Bacteroidota bacterium]MBS1740830.1 hypothetical protein [Bacteroidota bacterium]
MRLFSLALIVWFMTGCNMEPRNHTAEIVRLKDTLFQVLPHVQRVSIEVNNDFGEELIVTLGSKELYNADEVKRKEVAKEVSTLSKAIFSAKLPGQGKVLFVAEESTIINAPGSEKSEPMLLK